MLYWNLSLSTISSRFVKAGPLHSKSATDQQQSYLKHTHLFCKHKEAKLLYFSASKYSDGKYKNSGLRNMATLKFIEIYVGNRAFAHIYIAGNKHMLHFLQCFQ